MSWLLSVTHHSGYRYAGPVFSSYNEARVTPRHDATQRVLDASVEVSPAASLFRYVDYFGSVVTAFDLHVPHSEMGVTGRCVVETNGGAGEPGDTPGWDLLADDTVTDELCEYVLPTPRTAADGTIRAAAAEVRAARDLHAAGLLAAGWAHDRLAYVPGTTDVHSSAADALAEGRGVCQDYAHVTVAVLRAAGVPARYVSGYLHPRPEAGVGETVEGQSHAWVEWWAGGWHAFDPTNGSPPSYRHIVLARGRDYVDVAPLKGIYHGGRGESLGVTVSVTRLR